jgi:hypothetical protein
MLSSLTTDGEEDLVGGGRGGGGWKRADVPFLALMSPPADAHRPRQILGAGLMNGTLAYKCRSLPGPKGACLHTLRVRPGALPSIQRGGGEVLRSQSDGGKRASLGQGGQQIAWSGARARVSWLVAGRQSRWLGVI